MSDTGKDGQEPCGQTDSVLQPLEHLILAIKKAFQYWQEGAMKGHLHIGYYRRERTPK
jgi:hypothetical protein